MNVRKLWTEDRAVSPVVGVALLIAITVILAAVIGGVVLGLGTSSADAPQASLQFQFEDNSTLLVNHAGGDSLNASNIEVRTRGNATVDSGIGGELSAGEQGTVSLDDNAVAGDEVSIVWMDPNSQDEVVLGSAEYQP